MSAPALTVEQLAAVERRDGSLLVSAAAGSGKTSVLVERFVRSVVEDGIEPGAILAITFTDKAAGELRSRIRARFLALGERGLAQQAEGAWISTIHGFCARVLRSHAVRAGLAPAFSVLDAPSARELRAAAFDDALAGFLDGGDVRADALELVAVYGPDRLAAAVLDAHDALRAGGREPRLPPRATVAFPSAEREALEAACRAALAELAELDGARAARARELVDDCAQLLARLVPGQAPARADLDRVCFAPGRVGALQGDGVATYLGAREAFADACADRAARSALVLFDELLVRFADAYASAKERRAVVDFDDLELRTRDLFRASPALAASYAERFARLMVDEFQDTNRLQLELLGALDRGNAFLVGDERQSIYGFRHASVEIFRERQAELGADGATASLATNFRSRPEVLAAVNRVPVDEDGRSIEPGRAAAGEPRVELVLCERDGWPDDDLLPASQPWRRAEARLIAARLAELVASGAHAPGDVVVLMRAAGDMATYEGALEDVGLPTLAAGGGFWARQQVLDLCAYLAAIANPQDDRALLGVLASPLGASASPDAIALLGIAARARRHSLWDVLASAGDAAWGDALSSGERERIAGFAEAFAAERRQAPRLGLDVLLERAVRRSRYDEHVLAMPGGARRLANVAKLVRLAAAYEAERGRDVRAFVDRAVAELEAGAREPDAPVELGGLDAVRLMTIHAAKGLEFPVVAVVDLGRSANLQTPDVLVDDERVGIRVVPMHGRSVAALDYAELRDERLAREAEEERRILHVAMTRAEERLLLVGSARLDAWPSPSRSGPPIAWLAPAVVPDLAMALAAGETIAEVGDVRVAIARPGSSPTAATGSEREPVEASAATPEQLMLALTPDDGNTPAHTSGNASAGALARALALESTSVPEPSAPGVRSLATFSYSALSRHTQCGYRFYLERILRLPPQEAPRSLELAQEAVRGAPGIDALTRGSLAHELLERVGSSGEGASDDDIRSLAAEHEVELDEEEVADLRRLVAAAIASPLAARVRSAPDVRREQPFSLALEPEDRGAPLLTGVVDLLAWEHDGTALVLDYKTDRLGDADPEAVVAASYGVQRRIYALAALRAGATRVEVAHLFLERPDEPASAMYRAEDAPRLEAEIVARAASLLAGEFEVAEHPHRDLCATCPGRGGLCSWPEEVTLRSLEDAV